MEVTIKDKKPRNLTENAFSGFIWMIMGSASQVVLKIGVLAVLARLVTPHVFGIMSIALMVIDFSKRLTQMGVGPALVQRQELEHRHLTSGFTLSLAMGVFFGTLLILLAPLLAVFFKMPELTTVLRVISLVFLIDSLTLIGQALMQRNMRFRMAAAFEVVSYALGYGAVGIFLAYQGWGVWAMVSASLAQAVLFTVMLVWAQPFPKRLGFDKAAIKDLLFFGGGFTLANVGNYFATQGDNLVVGKTLGASLLGIYDRAYQFMVMPSGLFGNALDRAMFPAMAKVQHDKQRLGKAYLTGVGLIALIAIPLSFIIVFVAKEIVLILLGPKWVEVIVPFQILASSLLFRMGYKISESLARATGAVYQRAWRQAVYAGLVLTGSYIGHFWGLQGVAYGADFAYVINFLLMAHLSLQLTNVRWFDILRMHRYGLGAGAVVGGLAFGCNTLCRQYFTSNLLILTGTVIGSVVPFAMLVYFFPKLIMNDDFKKLLDNLILKKLKKKQPKNEYNKPETLLNPVSTLPLIRYLFDTLHRHELMYCLLRSNPDHVRSSFTGESDMDVLIDVKQKEKVESVLQEHGFKKFDSTPERKSQGIDDFIKLDNETGKLIHLHTHYRLAMGPLVSRNYQLGLEAELLASRSFNNEYGVYEIPTAHQLLVLYCDKALGLRTRDYLPIYLFKKTNYGEKEMQEYNWLKARTSDEELQKLLISVFRDSAYAHQLISKGFDKKQLLKFRGLLKKEFGEKLVYTTIQTPLTN